MSATITKDDKLVENAVSSSTTLTETKKRDLISNDAEVEVDMKANEGVDTEHNTIDYHKVIVRRCMEATARAIANGTTVEDVEADPSCILSGKKEYIILKCQPGSFTRPDGVLIPLDVVEILKRVKDSWACSEDYKIYKENDQSKPFAILKNRYYQPLADFIFKKRIKVPDVVVVKVPVERWSYYVVEQAISDTMVGDQIMMAF